MPEIAVAIDGVSKVFGGLKAVDDVSIAIAGGERRVLIGPNGAGKTTLFHCITGTLLPSSGRVRLFDEDVTRLPEHRRTRLGMGRTFQITNVFSELSTLENLILATVGPLPAKWTLHRRAEAMPTVRDTAEAVLEKVGLAGRLHQLVKHLSYGERRQLELGLALVSRPKVLFLDEPCAGLAPHERQRFVRIVQDLPRALTIVFIEHDMDVALGLADRVSVLHRGRLILDGRPEEIRADPQVREVYFGRA